LIGERQIAFDDITDDRFVEVLGFAPDQRRVLDRKRGRQRHRIALVMSRPVQRPAPIDRGHAVVVDLDARHREFEIVG